MGMRATTVMDLIKKSDLMLKKGCYEQDQQDWELNHQDFGTQQRGETKSFHGIYIDLTSKSGWRSAQELDFTS